MNSCKSTNWDLSLGKASIVMKTITITLLCMMPACSSSFAQINPPKNELGLNLYGLEIDVDYLGDGLQQPYYMNGLQYKRLINQHYKWRVSGQYHTRHEEGSVNIDPMQFSTSWNYIT